MNAFDSTKPYQRLDGKPAKILYHFKDGRLLVLYEDALGYENYYETNSTGEIIDYDRGQQEPEDLINVPEKIEGWNVYWKDEGFVNVIFHRTNPNKEIAFKSEIIACIPVSFIVGEGLD